MSGCPISALGLSRWPDIARARVLGTPRLSHPRPARERWACCAAILDAETVEKMVPNCPEPSDVELVNGYEGDLKLLGKAELCHPRDRIATSS
eukprot:COSAG01_NODE_5103_length_4481_cov_13.715883_2_plen_93_part_00